MKQKRHVYYFQIFIGFLFIGCMLLQANRVSAAAVVLDPQWGAEATTATFWAPSYWTDFALDSDGGVAVESAYSDIADARGNAKASAELLAGGGITPTLKAEAYHTSEPSLDGAYGSAFAIEAYQYNGLATLDLTLTGTLTGDLYKPSGSDDATGISAQIYIFKERNFYYCGDIGTLLGEYLAVSKGDFSLGINETVTGGVDADSMTFTVDPGEIFYLWAELNTYGLWDNAYADAFSTLTLDFDQDGDLQAHALGNPAVPIPSAILMIGPALLALIGLRRKIRNA